MGFAKFLLCGFCVFVASIQSAEAAFNYGAGENSQSKSIEGPISSSRPEAVPAHKIVPPTDPAAPSLEIYNDRYVPDTVKKKYGLNDSWFDKGLAPAPVVQEPQQITPPDMALPSLEAAPAREVVVQSWRARKGENVRDVMRRWSEREKTELMWASEDVPVLKSDFSYVGKFQDAVNQLVLKATEGKLHLQYRSEGMEPVMMSPASMVQTSERAPDMVPLPEVEPPVPVQMKLSPDTKNAPVLPTPSNKQGIADLPMPDVTTKGKNTAVSFEPPVKSSPETRWLGLSGAPLAEVLKVWAEEADIVLIWQAESNYALQSSVSKTGTFEEAVYEALNQYNDMPVRPVGEMYNDAKTGSRVLVVRTAADN